MKKNETLLQRIGRYIGAVFMVFFFIGMALGAFHNTFGFMLPREETACDRDRSSVECLEEQEMNTSLQYDIDRVRYGL